MSFSQVINDFESPDDYGFYMPAEWESHDRCWMVWPHAGEYWLDCHDDTKRAYVRVAKAIRQFEPVSMLVTPAAFDEARELLGSSIDIVEMTTDQAWMRDSGPNFLINDRGELAGSTWQFNAWGGKYRQFANDALLGDRLLASLGLMNFTSPIYAEGGAVSVDGQGTVLTTESCLLNSNRNPAYSKLQIEAELCRSLGAKKIIWLSGNPPDKETDGHVDGSAIFVKPGVVLLQRVPGDEAYHAENMKVLTDARDANGRALKIVLIDSAVDAQGRGEKFCRSYVNSYLANGGVVMPAYGIEADKEAKAVFAEIFPDRKIVQVEMGSIAAGGGGIHCITQQQPTPRRNR